MYTTRLRPIVSAGMSRIYQHLHSGVPIAMISADRGKSSRRTNETNRCALRVDINSQGYPYITLHGTWHNDDSSDEISFFVIGLDRYNNEIVSLDELRDFAIDCCQKYNQDAVIVGKMIDNNTNTMKFELLKQDASVANTFTYVRFGTPKTFEDLHEKYIQYREKHEPDFNREKDDYGYGYTRKRKNDNAFAMLNEKESELNSLKSSKEYSVKELDKILKVCGVSK